MIDSTLIVSASYDDSHRDWYDALPDPKVRADTSDGGYVSGALIDAYRFLPRYSSYLIIQDTMEPIQAKSAVPGTAVDVVSMFVEAGEKYPPSPVTAWAGFPLFFDNGEQESWVTQQYPYVKQPALGIFGPVFYVERKVLERLDKLGRFPKKPSNKNEANGTERAWAYALAAIGIEPAFLHPWSEEHLMSGDALPFRKVFAGRQ